MKNSRSDRIQYIKDKWDVITYAHNILGWPVYKDGDRTISYAPGSDNKTALIVHDKNWHDFKTGTGGDVIDLCALVKYNGDKGAAIRDLSEGYTGSGQSLFDWQKYTQNLCNKIQFWHEHLRECDKEYLHSRKINDETIERLKLGYDSDEDRLIIPYFKNGYIAYYAGRDRSGNPEASKYKKAALDGFNENIPWGLHTFTPEHRAKFKASEKDSSIDKENLLIITEGAFDAISFEQEGFKVLSPIGGFFSKKVVEFVCSLARSQGIKRVFLCFDSDTAGNTFQTSMGKVFFEHRIDFISGILPEKYNDVKIKDVSDYYTAGGDLNALVSQSVSGIESLASRITDKYEFRKFVTQAARFCDNADLSELFSKCEHFDKDWLGAVKQQCMKCPSESVIISAVTAKYKLRYVERVGFYEYTHGVWTARSDNYISSYFENELGKFASGNKFGSLLKYLRSQVTTEELFNTQNVFNFQNGMLILDTGELKPHSESYNSSIQMSYSYNPELDCPQWKKFVGEIMCEDAAKMSLIQEMAGYILFPDLRMQKCFFLMGDGGNGKSVFINVLRQVFGEDNCSSVPISNLGTQFEPIRLLNSLVNFTTETETKVNEAEARFKAIVTGDRISACYKGKDFIEFNPRAVMISACNKFINSTDSTRGFLRRIVFINFTRNFEGQDDNKNLTNELCAELPGIFNWCYEGYKRLMETQQFTATKEQNEMLEDFSNIIDPVRAFFRETLDEVIYEKFESKLLYIRYTEWCKNSGHAAQSRQRFVRSLKQILKRERPGSVFSHSGGETTILIQK